MGTVEINAITVVVTDMARSVAFYTDLGFAIAYGGPDAEFTSLRIGANFVNLQHTGEVPGTGWGRVIFHVASPDEVHDTAIAAGHQPDLAPADAPWGERYFHIRDPDGHELSFARRLDDSA
jgi:catechol 2,3-dioxygenase-like lactoylglutathione lyase family enzyme